MKFKKLISSSLVLGLLFNNISVSLASMPSEDGRYETFEGNNITIDNILEEDKVDIEVEGNTLVNLVKMPNIKEKRIETSSTIGTDNILANFNNKFNIKQNTTYTFIVDVKVTNATYNFSTYVKLGYINSNDENIYSSTVENQIIDDGFFRFVKTFTTSDDAVKFNNLSVIANSTNGNISAGTQTVTNMILLEGDYSDTYFNYFEDTKSVGQDNKNKHEIEILSKNDNLIEYIELNGVSSGSGEDFNHSAYMRTNYFLVEENSLYNVTNLTSNTKNLVAYCYDKNRNYISYVSNIRTSFTTPIKTRYVRLDMKKLDNTNFTLTDVENANIQVSKKKYDYYLPHESTTLKIPLSEPLRSLPNGVKDRIIKRNGQWVVERNCREIVLDGTEAWVNATVSPTNVFETNIPDIARYSSIGEVLCNNFPYHYTNLEIWHTYDGIVNLMQRKVLCIRNSKTDTILDLQKWLNKNPLTVVYQLENPVYEPLNINLIINTYLDVTHISNNSNIPANMNITIDRTINRATEAIELAKTNPTVANISQARMWSNLLKESTNKDSLQNEINSITNIEDLQLERKTATSNVDVYVKSENMLLMSLSTNNITFDNFSGVEDMKLDNAINISINSSLPYQLNSYLLSEIENSDKSNRIEKDLLNIKSNIDNNYKTFNNINEKLILEDDCRAGNNKSHSIDLKLKGSQAHKADIYKTVIKFEAEQK